MTQTTFSRSVLEISTQDFKRHFREYLRDLAQDTDPARVQLIEALEWCFDRWEYWRQKFYPDADLTFPFFQSMKRGSEFGHYSTMGSSGQPSVIHIKRAYLLGTSDITVWRISPTQKLVLKADHPDRLKFVDQTILHELVHQYLHEASPIAPQYENESKWFGGHGSHFAHECNRINLELQQELGFDFVPVRHTKTARAKLADKQRPSCAHFTHGELFWCWDPAADDLTDWQLNENRQRLHQALDFYGGAVVLVEEAAKVETDFPAPFDASCADVCHQELTGYDSANGTEFVTEFHLMALQQMQAAGTLDEMLRSVGHASSRGHLNILPARKQQMELLPAPAVDESLVEYQDGSTHTIDEFMADVGLGSVPVSGDSPLDLRAAYPDTDPAGSLQRLNRDINNSGLTKADFAQRMFDHKNGQQLSRHLKRLREAVSELVAA